MNESRRLADLSASLLKEGVSIQFTARGNSMKPFVRDGDVITVHPVDAQQLRVGHIILFAGEDKSPVLHRITRISKSAPEPSIIARGDSNIYFEETLSGDHVIGLASERQRLRRVIRLDAPAYLLLGRLWLALHPLRKSAFRLLCRIRRQPLPESR